MEKASYFSHDSNALDDPKCMMLVTQLGMEGYGIFWALVEKLRQQKDYKLPLALLPALAKKFDTSAAKVEAVVRSYGLFEIDESENFFSESLNRRMTLMNDKIERRKLASAKANAMRWHKTEALPENLSERDNHFIRTESETDPNGMQNESERNPNGVRTDSDFIQNRNRNINKKENRVKEKVATFVAPSLSEIEEYIKAKNMPVDANRFYCFYESKGWMIGKNKMKNWHMALSTWVRRESQPSEQQPQKSVWDGCE